AGAQVRMAQLGYQYEQTAVRAIPVATIPKADPLTLLISEDKPQIHASESQTFYLLVYNDRTKEPLVYANATLAVMFPNGANYAYKFPTTGVNGWSKLEIPSLPENEHGVLVAYQICLVGENPICEMESYLIWNHR
ncbi:MAG TPA: hypothetical protein VLH85_05010, partial [Levilinea sp.]|nr:hypothetical protein [Levilinea sp.]